MPSDIPENVPSKALFAFYDTPSRRPYQAYCVTEASSRPPSPDPLVPKPLRASAPPLWQAAVNTDFADTGGFEQNSSCIQAAASSPEQYVESVKLRKAGHYNKRQTSPPNRKPLHERTGSGKNSNHITRAVTPRGSHSLASSEVIAYDRPPSNPRMRQLDSSKKEDIRLVLRKPMEHENFVGTYQRPLPPLPLEIAPVGPGPNQQDDAWSEKAYREACGQSYAQHSLPFIEVSNYNTETLSRWKAAEYLIPRRPLPDPPVPGLWSRGTALKEKVTSLSLTGYLYNAVVCESSQSPREPNGFSDCTQDPPTAELHVPRGHWEDIDDDVRAPQQTQEEYASLRYQLGQLPSHNSALPPLVSPQRDSCLQPVHLLADSAPLFHSSRDIQNGPRPPPWGSYEDLENQRRQRGDARERAKVHLNRLTADSKSTYQKSISSDSLGKDPSREVEEYKEQILGVYPDMEFNVDAGRGDREWCCCVMM